MTTCIFCGRQVPEGRESCPRCGAPVQPPDPVSSDVDERTTVRHPVLPPDVPASVPPSPPVWPGSPAVGDSAPPPQAPPPPVVAPQQYQPWPPAPTPPGPFVRVPVQQPLAAGAWDWERQTTIVLVLGIANGLFRVPQYLVMQASGFHGDFSTLWAIGGLLDAGLGFFLARIATASARACRGTLTATIGWVGVGAWGVLALLDARIWDAWSTLGALGIIAGLITGLVSSRIPHPDSTTRLAAVSALAGVPVLALSNAVGPPADAFLRDRNSGIAPFRHAEVHQDGDLMAAPVRLNDAVPVSRCEAAIFPSRCRASRWTGCLGVHASGCRSCAKRMATPLHIRHLSVIVRY